MLVEERRLIAQNQEIDTLRRQLADALVWRTEANKCKDLKEEIVLLKEDMEAVRTREKEAIARNQEMKEELKAAFLASTQAGEQHQTTLGKMRTAYAEALTAHSNTQNQLDQL